MYLDKAVKIVFLVFNCALKGIEMNKISLSQLRQANSKVLTLLSTESEWILTRYGKPFARIKPMLNVSLQELASVKK